MTERVEILITDWTPIVLDDAVHPSYTGKPETQEANKLQFAAQATVKITALLPDENGVLERVTEEYHPIYYQSPHPTNMGLFSRRNCPVDICMSFDRMFDVLFGIKKCPATALFLGRVKGLIDYDRLRGVQGSYAYVRLLVCKMRILLHTERQTGVVYTIAELGTIAPELQYAIVSTGYDEAKPDKYGNSPLSCLAMALAARARAGKERRRKSQKKPKRQKLEAANAVLDRLEREFNNRKVMFDKVKKYDFSEPKHFSDLFRYGSSPSGLRDVVAGWNENMI
jgi:hypothetical protein